MNGQDVQFSPKDGFLVTHADYFNEAQQTYLIYLYQPMLGPIATALYNTLKTLEEPHTLRSQRPMHRVLLDYMNVDPVEIEAGRRRLEALGLLRTFVNEDQLGKYFVYELYPPLKPDAFFNEDLLSLLLLQTIGDQAFEKLKTKFQLHPVKKDLQEITANYANVFPEIIARAVAQPSALAETKHQMHLKVRQPVQYTTADLDAFDWTFLQDLVSRYQISKSELAQHKQVIFQLHHFYDIDETAMARLIASTVDIATNEINISKLESLILAEYTQTVGTPIQASEPAQPAPVGADSSDSDLDASQKLVLSQARKLSVSDFLAWQKELHHGFVGKEETRHLRDLQNRHVMPDEMLNMLIYASLENHINTVTLAFSENVGNDWMQNGITTPEAAMARISAHTYSQNGKVSRSKQTTGANTYRASPAKANEPIPKWFKQRQAQKKAQQTDGGEDK